MIYSFIKSVTARANTGDSGGRKGKVFLSGLGMGKEMYLMYVNVVKII